MKSNLSKMALIGCLFFQQSMAIATFDSTASTSPLSEVTQNEESINDTIHAILGNQESNMNSGKYNDVAKALVDAGVTPSQFREYMLSRKLVSADMIADFEKHRGVRTAGDLMTVAGFAYLAVYGGFHYYIGEWPLS